MSKRSVDALSFLFFLGAALAGLPASATGSPSIVISQVYGGGGFTGAPYTNDFIELFNRGPAVVDVSTWSVQYAAATGTSWARTNLTGTIQPGAYYLVQEASAGGAGAALPAADAVGILSLSTTTGKVALVSNQTLLTGSGCPLAAEVVDFVGYGTSADCSEGGTPAAAPAVTLAVLRAAGGFTDTDSNGTDFAVGAPRPRNSASVVNVCSVGTDDIVVSQIYGAGGGPGTLYLNDFVELFNRGRVAVDVSTWSVQYASATGTSWSMTDLTGTIQPGAYYLVREASAGTTGASLPAADAVGNLSLSTTTGKVALVSNQTSLTPSGCPLGAAGVVDFVGYGTSASCAAGGTPTAAPSATLSVLRAGEGCTSTGSNSSDFTTAAPAPRNSASPTNVCIAVSQLYTITPCRIFDTRSAAGLDAASPALAPGETRILGISGRCSIPQSAKALSVNQTVTEQTAAGELIVYRSELASRPSTSNISFTAGKTRGNSALLELPRGCSETIKVFNSSAGTVQFILDVNGYFQ